MAKISELYHPEIKIARRFNNELMDMGYPTGTYGPLKTQILPSPANEKSVDKTYLLMPNGNTLVAPTPVNAGYIYYLMDTPSLGAASREDIAKQLYAEDINAGRITSTTAKSWLASSNQKIKDLLSGAGYDFHHITIQGDTRDLRRVNHFDFVVPRYEMPQEEAFVTALALKYRAAPLKSSLPQLPNMELALKLLINEYPPAVVDQASKQTAELRDRASQRLARIFSVANPDYLISQHEPLTRLLLRYLEVEVKNGFKVNSFGQLASGPIREIERRWGPGFALESRTTRIGD